MKDKELDQILQHALTPTVSDEEIKVNYEMEGRPMMKKKNYFKPAVALVACAALVAGCGFRPMHRGRSLSPPNFSKCQRRIFFWRNHTEWQRS